MQMRFIWNADNVAHIARHGVTPDQVEAVFDAQDFGCQPSRGAKQIGEGTIDIGLVRVAYYRDAEEILPVTAHRIRRRRTTSGDAP
jgi:uncharacterized DUF497 family protein